jgi:hypothetical protein
MELSRLNAEEQAFGKKKEHLAGDAQRPYS